MMEHLGALFLVWCALNIVHFVISLVEGFSYNWYLHYAIYTNPFEIYDELDVNWFGAIILALLFTAVFPLMSIQYWICWLFTVGRD